MVVLEANSGSDGRHSEAPLRRKVALLIETSRSYGRGLLAGVGRYVNMHRNWSVTFEERALNDPVPPWLAHWRGDGILVRSASEEILRVVRRRSVPVVYLGELRDTGLPTLHSNDRGISQRAVEHLYERRIENFGFVGLPGIGWSDRRLGFTRELLAAKGLACEVFLFTPSCVSQRTWLTQERGLSQWLTDLPKPAGVIACSDVVGVRVLDLCRTLGIAVPEEVAVIGVDNDPQFCQLADPPLSSVAHDLDQIGYKAAAYLDRLIASQESMAETIMVEPLGVACRKSTDVLAIPDEQVARAWRFIREHACDGIDMADISRFVGMHPVTLKRRFETYVGHSPKAEIMRLQLERVKLLLRETDFPLDRIADQAGFRYSQYMSLLFRRKEGMPPGEYRQRNKSV